VTPGGVRAAAIRSVHELQYGIRAVADPLESVVALASAKAGARLVMVSFTGGVPAEAAPAPTVGQMRQRVGMRDPVSGAEYRIEFDTRSGAHINVEVKKIKGPHIKFESGRLFRTLCPTHRRVCQSYLQP
jgi:hypothetical protein